MSTISSKIQQKGRSNLAILLHSSLLGVWRSLIGLPFQHPFDNIKTNMQAYQTNFSNTFKNIYSRQGILGFYSGFFVNSLRIASKQIYRWPLQIGLLGFYSQIFKDKISRGTLGIICGINIALIQVVIICPFQRMKVWLMTASKHAKMKQFFNKLNFKSLFDGFLPVLGKQLISWVTFLGGTQMFKDIAYKNSNKNRFQDQLSLYEIMFVSSAVALLNTFFVMPIDCIKTQFQKNSNSEAFNPSSHKLTLTMKQIYLKYGLRGFYKGWQIKLIQYSINSLFTVMLFQNILKEYERNGIQNSNSAQLY